MGCTEESDIFSVGCIIAQLWTRSPLLKKYQLGPNYLKNMSRQYYNLFGPFPVEYVDVLKDTPGVTALGRNMDDVEGVDYVPLLSVHVSFF